MFIFSAGNVMIHLFFRQVCVSQPGKLHLSTNTRYRLASADNRLRDSNATSRVLSPMHHTSLLGARNREHVCAACLLLCNPGSSLHYSVHLYTTHVPTQLLRPPPGIHNPSTGASWLCRMAGAQPESVWPNCILSRPHYLPRADYFLRVCAIPATRTRLQS